MNKQFQIANDKLARLKRAIAIDLGEGRVTAELEDIRLRVEGLAWGYIDIYNYDLVVTHPEVSSNEEPITIQLSGDMSTLVLGSLAKFAYDRSEPETAVLVVLAHLASKLYSQTYGDLIVFTPSQVSIRPTDPDD